MTTSRRDAEGTPTPVTELEIIASLGGKQEIDIERLFDKQLSHRHRMDVRAWRYRMLSFMAGVGVFVFFAWFAVRLADQGNAMEAVGVVGFGGLPMVALFVTGEVVSRRMLK